MRATSRHFHLEPLTEGVYAAIARDGGAAGSNAGIIDLGDRCLLFDTLLTPQAADDLVSLATQITRMPIWATVLSHWHADHVAGSVALPPDIALISTTATREQIAATLPGWIEEQRRLAPITLDDLRERITTDRDPVRKLDTANAIATYEALIADLPRLDVRLPDITFEHRLALHGPHRTAHLLCFGGGHTVSDTVLYLPDDQILFAGDLVFYERHPWLGSGDPDAWLRIYDQIEALEPAVEIVVAGHGAVCMPDAFADLRRYWPALQTLVREALVRDMRIDEVAALPVPAAFTDWGEQPTFANNMRWLYERMAQT